MELWGNNMELVKAITVDWFYSTEFGEEYTFIDITKKEVSRIEYHKPNKSDNTHYCNVYYSNGVCKRLFNINDIIFFNAEEDKAIKDSLDLCDRIEDIWENLAKHFHEDEVFKL